MQFFKFGKIRINEQLPTNFTALSCKTLEVQFVSKQNRNTGDGHWSCILNIVGGLLLILGVEMAA